MFMAAIKKNFFMFISNPLKKLQKYSIPVKVAGLGTWNNILKGKSHMIPTLLT
jgi:hypothetical protein